MPVTRTAMSATTPRLRWRPVALPVAHGVWGFLLEPSLLGLLLYPTLAAAGLVAAGLGAVLLHTPMSLLLADLRRGRRYPRTALAARFALAYAAVALAAMVLVLATIAVPWSELVAPIFIAAPLVGLQFYASARFGARDATAEISGALALGVLASLIALVGGAALVSALLLWAALAARSLPAIVYVRARVRLERGEAVNPWPSRLSHLFALGLLAAFIAAGFFAPWTLLAYLLLAARAEHGLSQRRRRLPATIIGFSEIGYGVLVAVALAFAHR